MLLGDPETSKGTESGMPGDAMTNLERYKQKLKTQRVIDQPHTTTSHRPSLAYKASVRDTVSKLQEQSRLNGSAYGTNQFSSMDVRTREQENTGKASMNDRAAEESDNERLGDDTTSEEGAKKANQGASGHGTGQRFGQEPRSGSAKAGGEYA